jgi:hypothetical protein
MSPFKEIVKEVIEKKVGARRAAGGRYKDPYALSHWPSSGSSLD